jgi:hypothetical protein
MAGVYMLRDFARYIRRLFVRRLQGFWFVTAIPQLFQIFYPAHAAKIARVFAGRIPIAYQAILLWAVTILGFFIASFLEWRKLDAEIGLRVRITNANYQTTHAPSGTRCLLVVDIFNNGQPTIAADWTLKLGRRTGVRASERSFFVTNGGDELDPLHTPIPQGGHWFGTLSFLLPMSEHEARKLEKKRRLTFKDAALRTLHAVES